MSTISERLGISKDLIELKFGKSFTRNVKNASKYVDKNSDSNKELYHTIRYDFKPVSVDTSQTATIEFNEKNKVTVTAPNVEGSGMPCTVFQGNRKPYLKECVLVIDHETGDFTLERLTNNLVVKKTRTEGSSRSKPNTQQRPITPNVSGQKSVSPKLSNQSISNKSPPNNSNFTTNHRSPIEQKLVKEKFPIQQQQPQQQLQPSLNSMPIFNSATFSNNLPVNSASSSFANNYNNNIGVLSSSSSSSSSDDDDDDNDNDSSSSGSSSSSEDEEENNSVKPTFNNYVNSNITAPNKKNIMSSFSSSEADSDDEDEKLKKLNNNLLNSLNNGLSNCGLNSNNISNNNNNSVGYTSMSKFSDLNNDLQLSESGSDSE